MRYTVDRPQAAVCVSVLATLRVQLPRDAEKDRDMRPPLGGHDFHQPRGLVIVERQPLACRRREDASSTGCPR